MLRQGVRLLQGVLRNSSSVCVVLRSCAIWRLRSERVPLHSCLKESTDYSLCTCPDHILNVKTNTLGLWGDRHRTTGRAQDVPDGESEASAECEAAECEIPTTSPLVTRNLAMLGDKTEGAESQ
jgi:hypothetical protein